MKPVAALVILLLTAFHVAACKDAPGADGRYATHDHGALNNGP